VKAALCEALASVDFEVKVYSLKALDTQHSGRLAVYAPALLQVLLTFENLASEDTYDTKYISRPEEEMRDLALKLLKRVDPSELVEHMQPVFDAQGYMDGPLTLREMAMHAVSLLPPSAVAPHAQLVLQRMKEHDDWDMKEAEEDAEIGMRMRDAACDVLSRLEVPVLARLLPELLTTLEDSTARSYALFVLGQLPPAMLCEHIPAVLGAHFNNWCLEEEGARLLILEEMDASALAAHTGEFQEALRHTDEYIRHRALLVLAKFPLASIAVHAATLRDLLADPDSLGIQALAVELLARLPEPALADGLATLPAQPEVRAGLLQALSKLPASASAAPPPAAVQMLQDTDASVRASAIAALKRLDPSALEEGVLLRMALGDSDRYVRGCAMRALGNFPATVLVQHVPKLLQALEDSDSSNRSLAAEVLKKVDGSMLTAHTTVLLASLMDDNKPQHVRQGAATRLELVPPDALAPHLSRLLALFLLGSDQRALRESVEGLLQRVVASVTPDAVAEALIFASVGPDRVQQLALDRVICHLPAQALRLHAPLLMSMIVDPHASLREKALRTVQKLDPADLAKEHPALLLLGLLDPKAEVRSAAVCALCALPRESLALHAAEVLRMLWDSHKLVRQTAVKEAENMLEKLQAPELKQQLRRAAVDACKGGGVLGTLRRRGRFRVVNRVGSGE
jgi:HEAT repeat protein